MLSPAFEEDAAWEDNPDRVWDAAAMSVHAAMIDRVDQGVGRIVAKLRELDQLENTLILLLSDNGASREEPGRPGFDRVSETRDGRPVRYFGRGATKDTPPGPEETYAGIGPHWANVANTPWRLFKATQYEGGVRTPLIVHWPAAVSGGGISRQVGHVIDVLPTCLDVAGEPIAAAEHEAAPLAGVSLAASIRDKAETQPRTLFFEHFGHRAVRKGDWKLVAGASEPWELYELARDGSETTNLAVEYPRLVAELDELWQGWAEANQVFPRPN